jgi:hypothetical protein
MKLSETLLSHANWNARKAFEQFQSDDLHFKLNAAACAGMAAELLLKYLLARHSPSLLAELTTGDKAGALTARVEFSSDDYAPALAEVRSCTAEDAFYIHDTLVEIPTVIARDEFSDLMNVRNAACHLAALSSRSRAIAAIHSLLSMYEKAQLAIPDLEWPFTGLDAQVEMFQYQYRQTSIKAVKAKIVEHKADFHSGQSSVDPDDPESFLDIRAYSIVLDEYSDAQPERVALKCVACGSPEGQLLCEAETRTFYKPDEPDATPTEWAQGKRLSPAAFGCTNCRLCLSPRELRTLEAEGDGWAVNAMKLRDQHSDDFEAIPDEFQVCTAKS